MSLYLYRHRLLRTIYPETISFWSIYPLSILFVLHTFLVVYVNSTYMEQYISPELVGMLFFIGSAIAIIAFLSISYVLRAIGNLALSTILALVNLTALLTLGYTTYAPLAIGAFLVFLVANPLIFLCLDIFTESLIGDDESNTGKKRGLILTLMASASVLGTILMGTIAGDDTDLSFVYYTAAGIFILFLLFLRTRFYSFKDPEYKIKKVRNSIKDIWSYRDMRYVVISHLLLQIFYTWMVIYFPMYLVREIGMSWNEISIVIAIGLLAFVIFESPIGYIADQYVGEKEMMAMGFLVLAITSSWISFLISSAVIAWVVLMFISRIGASLVEATTESYFFKKIKGGDSDAISFFRLLRPLSNMLGALTASITLLFLPFNLMFIVLGIMMIPGIFISWQINDTK